GQDRQSIKWNVPDKLAPAFEQQIVGHSAGHIGAFEFCGNGVGARLRGAPVFTQNNVTVIIALDFVTRHAVQTNEAKPAQNTLRAEMLSQEFFISQAVLQCQQHGAFAEQRRDKIDKIVVRSCFDGDYHQITPADLFGRVVTIDLAHAKVLTSPANENAVTPNLGKITAHEKMHIASGMGELCAVIAPDCTRTNDRYAKRLPHSAQFL